MNINQHNYVEDLLLHSNDMRISSLCSLAFFQPLSILAAHANLAQNPPLQEIQSRDTLPFLGDNFVSLAYQGSAVIGNKLYIDGGEVTWRGSNRSESISGTLNSTLSIDLSQAWTPQNVTFNSYDKDDSMRPFMVLETLWPADNDSFYLFGGASSAWNSPGTIPPDLVNNLWQFSGNSWTQIQNDNGFQSLQRPANGLAAHSDSKAWMLGGQAILAGQTDRTPLPGIVSFDMKSGAWTNSTAWGVPNGGRTMSGVMQYVPNFGAEGLLIAIGGETWGPSTWIDEGSGMLSMNNITVYDPSSEQWYWQNTTGLNGDSDMPYTSSMPCAVGVQSSDSSFEM